MPKLEKLDHAQIRRDLLAQIDTAAAAEIALTAERDDISFKAVALKDPISIKRLSVINSELQRLAAERDSLKAALTEAARRSDAARAAELSEAQRQRAQKAAPIAKRLAERGQKMDEAIGNNVAEYAALQADIEELSRLGCPMPSRALIATNLRRANDSATAQLDRAARPVAPGQRRTFSELSASWSEPAARWIRAKLDKQTVGRDAA